MESIIASETDSAKFKLVQSQPQNITFHSDGKLIGTLYMTPPMHFEGDAKESAKIFFEQVIKLMMNIKV